MSKETTPAAAEEAGKKQPQTASSHNWRVKIQRAVFGIDTFSILISIVLALIIGAFIVALSNSDVQEKAGYFFARPQDTLFAIHAVFSDFFSSIFTGAIFDYNATDFGSQIRPLTNTLTLAIPLIFAGLSVAVAFRAGMFNIGAQGQLIMGAIISGLIGFSFHLPFGLHLLLALLGAVMGGAIWGAIPGYLKAKLGANEVVVTIMLNSIAAYFLARQLQTKLFIGNGNIGKSQTIPPSAGLPKLLGADYTLHWGFPLALLVAYLVWWLLERSTFGFELRATGANPFAAKTAGINVERTIFLTMVFAGALAGLASSGPVLGTSRVLTDGVANNYGFDAITVALLGRSHPLGVVLSAILFGALASGGATMQSAAGIPVDIVQVTQAIIVLLVAATEYMKYRKSKKKARARGIRGSKKERG